MPLFRLVRFLPLPALFVGLDLAIRAEEARAAELPAHYDRATVATARTSIYVGSVKLIMPPFAREGTTYRSTYQAKVFPFFFYNEAGTISMDISDEDLGRLGAGERIPIQGEASTRGGKPRQIEGHADPTDERSGQIKVRVWISRKIELIFNTTYQFDGDR